MFHNESKRLLLVREISPDPSLGKRGEKPSLPINLSRTPSNIVLVKAKKNRYKTTPKQLNYACHALFNSGGALAIFKVGHAMKLLKYLLIFVFMGGLLIIFGDRGLIDNYRLSQRLHDLKSQNEQLLQENKKTQQIISLLKEDLTYIEMIARRELGMTGKGELVYRFTQ